MAAGVADETSSEFVQVQCTAPDPIVAARIARRTRLQQVTAQMALHADPWPEATHMGVVHAVPRPVLITGERTG